VHWNDLERHVRFGFAAIDRTTGLIIRCTSSFARMVGADKRLLVGKSLSMYACDPDRGVFSESIDRVRSGDVEFASFGACFQECHCAIEVNSLEESNQLFVVICRSGDKEREMLAGKLDALRDKFIEFAETAIKLRPGAITNISGGQNVLGENSGEVSRE
jgi:hypothetical protein